MVNGNRSNSSFDFTGHKFFRRVDPGYNTLTTRAQPWPPRVFFHVGMLDASTKRSFIDSQPKPPRESPTPHKQTNTRVRSRNEFQRWWLSLSEGVSTLPPFKPCFPRQAYNPCKNSWSMLDLHLGQRSTVEVVLQRLHQAIWSSRSQPYLVCLQGSPGQERSQLDHFPVELTRVRISSISIVLSSKRLASPLVQQKTR